MLYSGEDNANDIHKMEIGSAFYKSPMLRSFLKLLKHSRENYTLFQRACPCRKNKPVSYFSIPSPPFNVVPRRFQYHSEIQTTLIRGRG